MRLSVFDIKKYQIDVFLVIFDSFNVKNIKNIKKILF
jgi:hypothetical protein